MSTTDPPLFQDRRPRCTICDAVMHIRVCKQERYKDRPYWRCAVPTGVLLQFTYLVCTRLQGLHILHVYFLLFHYSMLSQATFLKLCHLVISNINWHLFPHLMHTPLQYGGLCCGYKWADSEVSIVGWRPNLPVSDYPTSNIQMHFRWSYFVPN